MVVIIDPPSGLPVPRRTDRAPRRGRKAIRIPGPGDIEQVPAGVARDPGLDVDPKAFGSGVAEAVADFGQAVGRLGSAVERMNRRNDEAFAAAGLAALHERQSRAGLDARKDTNGGVAGFHDGRMAAFDRDLGEVLERAPSTGAREILKRQGAALRDLMSGGAARFEATARIFERRAAVDRELGNLTTLARQDPDDHALHRALLENLLGAASNELSADKMAPFRAAGEQRLAEASVRGFIERGDVLSARALLEAVGRDGPAGEAAPLSSEKVGALRKDIDRAADEARRAERRAVDALMEDHLASIQTTGAGLGGIAERVRAALDGKAFKAFERDEKDARAFHETMKSLKFARPEVIDRELEIRRPRKGARNFAEKQRRFQVLERGAKQMLNLRARDGAAFVMEMEDVRAAVEGAGTDGPDLRRALKFRMAMQADIGMPEDRVRLLTRAEAGALAGQVQSAAVEDRAAKVAEVQNFYGPLFGRAMKELTKAGLDPRFQVLAWARHTPALARTIARALEPGGAGPEQALDPAGSQKVRGRLRDLTADARPDAEPEGETADAIDAIRSATEALGVEYLRQTGRVEESAARAAAFANGAIEEMRLAAADDEDNVRDMVLRPEDQQDVVGPLGPARLIDERGNPIDRSRDVQPLVEKTDKGGEALENKGTGEDGDGGEKGTGGTGGEENGNDTSGKDEPTGTQLAQLSAPGPKARLGGLPSAASPVPNPKMRNDTKGLGNFGASRGGGTRKHQGVDLEAPAGSPVRSPVDGVVEKIGDPYRKGHRLQGQFNTIWIRTKTGFRVKMFYVNPQDRNGNPLVKPGDIVSAGQPIGTMQDRARHDKGMINHLHLEIRGGKGLRTAIDPAPWLKKWGVK